MRQHLNIAVFVFGLFFLNPNIPQADAQQKQVIALFNNAKIYNTDVVMNEKLKAEKQKTMSASEFETFEYTYRMELLARQIHHRLKNRILNQYGYEVTDEEVNAYLDYIRWIRNNPFFKTNDEQRTQIKGTISDWHFNSIIYQKYGGKVIATPFGYKPLEAYKALVDELLQENVFIISDLMHRGALTILYVYFERNTKNVVEQEKADSYFTNPHWGKFGIDISPKTQQAKPSAK